MRVYRDRDGDLWHEGPDGRLYCCDFEELQETMDTSPGGTFSSATNLYGPLTLVLDTGKE